MDFNLSGVDSVEHHDETVAFGWQQYVQLATTFYQQFPMTDPWIQRSSASASTARPGTEHSTSNVSSAKVRKTCPGFTPDWA
jgi:hypothetical protein